MSSFNLNVNMRGLRKLVKKADTAILRKPMRTFFTKTGVKVQGESRRRAPVDTGTLRNSIVYNVDKRPLPLWVKIGSNKKYAPFQEFGTRPHFPPPSALSTWARRHGLPSGFLAARAIARRGIKGKEYMQKGLRASRESIKAYLADAAKAVEKAWR